jgi:hypothetical protein
MRPSKGNEMASKRIRTGIETGTFSRPHAILVGSVFSLPTAQQGFSLYPIGKAGVYHHQGVEPDSTGIPRANPVKFYTHSTGDPVGLMCLHARDTPSCCATHSETRRLSTGPDLMATRPSGWRCSQVAVQQRVLTALHATNDNPLRATGEAHGLTGYFPCCRVVPTGARNSACHE